MRGRKVSETEPSSIEQYSIRSNLPLTHKLFSNTPRHQLTDFLDHIEYLASLGLTKETIAARLGLEWEHLRDFADKFPDVRAALRGGRARGVEEAAATVKRNSDMGDTAAAVALLKGAKEWTPAAQPAPIQVVNVGAMPAPVSPDRAAKMIEEQRLIDLEPDD